MKPMLKWGLAFLVVLVAGAILFLTIGSNRTGAFPPLPAPNGYDDFVAAGKMIIGDTAPVRSFTTNSGTAHEMELEQLRALVTTNAEAFRLFQLGLSRTSAVPLATFVTNQSRMLQDLGSIKRLAQFNLVVGRLAELEGRTNEAVAIHLQGMRFASEAIRSGVVIHGLVGVACENMAFTRLTNLTGRMSSSKTQEIISEMEQIDAAANSWTEMVKSERIFMSQVVPFDSNPIGWVRNWWTTWSLLRKEKERHWKLVVQRRRFLVELALRRYADVRGNPPQKLEELVPAYLSRLPENPATKQPPSYYPQGTNWSLEFKL
jgi:hypothetical protein